MSGNDGKNSQNTDSDQNKTSTIGIHTTFPGVDDIPLEKYGFYPTDFDSLNSGVKQLPKIQFSRNRKAMSDRYRQMHGNRYKQIRLVNRIQVNHDYCIVLYPAHETDNSDSVYGNIRYLKLCSIVFEHKNHLNERFKHIPVGNYLTRFNDDNKVYLNKSFYDRTLDLKDLSRYGQINTIIPRYHESKSEVITGMRIYCSTEKDEKYEVRTWVRKETKGWIGSNRSKRYGLGFQQMTHNDCNKELNLINEKNINEGNSYIGIYVPKNTSLVMIDTYESLSDMGNYHVKTVFQEGSLIILENIELLFNDFHYTTEKVLLMDLYILDKNIRQEQQKRLIYILRPDIERISYRGNSNLTQPSFASWGLIITHEVNNGKKIAVLQIPTNTRIEKVYEWEKGMTEIKRKMKSKPWNKYTKRADDWDNTDFQIDDFVGPFPGYDINSLSDNDWSIDYIQEISTKDGMGITVSKIEFNEEQEKPREISPELREYIESLYLYKEQTQTPQQTKYPTVKEWTQK